MIFPTVITVLDLVTERAAPANRHDLAKQLRAHSMHHFMLQERRYKEKGVNCAKAMEKLSKAWGVFLFWWNGCFSINGYIAHYTMLSGESATSRDHVIMKMAESLASLMHRALPGRPEKGKWTKTPPAYDFIALLLLPAGLLATLLDAAGHALRVWTGAFDGNWSALSFGETTALRFRHAKDLVSDEHAVFQLKLCLLLFIATRHLHTLFFQASRDLQSPVKPNMFLGYIHPEYSHATCALQFLASLAAGVNPLLQLLWDAYGSFDGWCRVRPDEARETQLTIYMFATSVYRIHVALAKLSLSVLVSCCDIRIPRVDRLRRFAGLLRKAKCCTGKYVGEFIDKIADVLSDVLQEDIQLVLRGLAHLLAYLMSVADCERRHNRHKQMICKAIQNFAPFCSRSFLEEVRSISARSVARVIEVLKALEGQRRPLLAQCTHRCSH